MVAKGYFVVDAALAYSNKKFDVGLFIENATNYKWKEAQFETESRVTRTGEPQTQIHFTAGTPFAAKLRVNYNF